MGSAPALISPNDWVDKRLAEIDCMDTASEKVRALVGLASGLLPSKTSVLDQAWAIAHSIQDEDAKSRALRELDTHLSKSQQQDLAMEKTRSTTGIMLEEEHIKISKDEELREIESCLSKAQQYQQALDLARFQEEVDKVEALTAIAPHLPESQLQEVLEEAFVIAILDREDEYAEKLHADSLSKLSHLLPRSVKDLPEEILSVAEYFDHHEESKVLILKAVASRLTNFDFNLLQKLLNIANSVEDKYAKTIALSAIIPCLTDLREKPLERVLDIASSSNDEYFKVKFLSSVLPFLAKTDKKLIAKAYAIADSIKHSEYKVEALTRIADYLPLYQQQKLLAKALDTADSIPESFSSIQEKIWKAQALRKIALHLPEFSPELVGRIVSAAKTIQYEQSVVKAQIGIRPELLNTEEDELTFSDRDLVNLSKGNQRKQDEFLYEYVALRSTIAYHFYNAKEREDSAKTLVSLAHSIQDVEYKIKALSAISLLLTSSQQHELFKEAFAYIEAIQNDFSKKEALDALSSLVEKNVLSRFLKAVFSLPEFPVSKNFILFLTRFPEEFAAQLPDSRKTLFLEKIIQNIEEDADKTKLISALIPRLSTDRLPIVIKLIRTQFISDRFRAETLGNLIPYLPPEQLPKALKAIIHSIKNPYFKAAALEDLIPIIGSYNFRVILKLIEDNEISHPLLQAKLLSAIAVALSVEDKSAPVGRVNQQVIPGLGKEKFLESVQAAVMEHVLDFPEIVCKILTCTQNLANCQTDGFSYEKPISEIYSHFAPAINQLTEPHRTQVFESIQKTLKTFQDSGFKADVLIAFAPYFPDKILEDLSSFAGDDYRILLNIKIQLALQEPAEIQTLSELRANILGQYPKVEAIVEIARSPMGRGYQSKALRDIREIKNNAYLQAQSLKRFIPSLEERQRFEAASVISDISDPYYRVTAHVTLARKFPESKIFNEVLKEIEEKDSKNKPKLNRIQQIEQSSILAIDMPELLPKIIKLAESLHTDQLSETTEITNDKEAETFPLEIERRDILVALAPHLPMRINREVNRELALGRFISKELYDRALYLLARGYRDALQGGTLRNDATQDRDLLDLKDEVNALSGLLLMRDLEPPMTVGILGGWGGGKSYIMHLMQAQMTAIRSRKVDVDVEAWNPDPNHEKLSPYVGHIYQIKFDAWTFAKSDLWASLMQTIFFELNRQISLEQQLARVLAANLEDSASRAKTLCEAGQYWPVLYKASEQDRQWFLERVLSPAQLAKFKAIHNQGQVDDVLWRQLGDTYQAENQKLEELEAELRRMQDELKSRKQDIRSQVDADKLNQLILKLTGPVSIILSNRISAPVLKQISEDITHQVKTQLSSQASADILEPLNSEHLKATIQAVAVGVFEHRYGEISFRSFLTWFQKNLRLFGLTLVFLMLAILLPVAADVLMGWLLPGIDNIFPRLIAFLAPLTPGIASAQALLKSSQKWVEETNLAVKEYGQQLETIPQQLEERREQLFQNQLEKVKEVATLEAEVKLLEEKVNAQRQRIPKNVYESLEAFVSDRIQDGSYEKRLGLMQQVKGDLAELSSRLLPPPADSQEFQWKVEQLQKVFPRGPARVVVYIDDLDRCPPDRVVQVLEAVQLLVKTPLFIAVLAIDERYITRALEQFYKGVLLRHGSPSGTDYLEKIIQLPYRVRPIMANSLETYLRSQVVIQDNATGGTKFSEFSRQEFKMLLACCQQVDLSPRTLKRLTNVYKLFKIVCRTRGTKTTPQVQQAILALLALSGRYPNLMRSIFDDIQTCFEENRTKQNAEALHLSLHLDSPLPEFFNQYQVLDRDLYLQRELDKLRHDALQTNILPLVLTLNDLGHDIFNLISSFSFVGEIGEDPEDYRFSNQP